MRRRLSARKPRLSLNAGQRKMNGVFRTLLPIWALIAAVWVASLLFALVMLRRNPSWRPRGADKLTEFLGFEMTGRRYLLMQLVGVLGVSVMLLVAWLILGARP